MSEIAIKVENLSKKYHIGHAQQRHDTLRDQLVDLFSAPFRRNNKRSEIDTIWALNDISFEVNRGDVLGIIGRNGAGKSTLLKILSQITEPTRGRAVINGRVGSLLEIGTGFHPELTGRENIYLYGAILGMQRSEIQRKFEEIVAFSEVEKFLDTPVKRYSSGMYVRLAFAVAAHMEPEILLVDEVLAVGDTEFQKKCLGKMDTVAKQGRTVLFVSHNMGTISELCESSLLLEGGNLVRIGSTDKIVEYYLQSSDSETSSQTWSNTQAPGGNKFKLMAIRVLNASGVSRQNFRSDEPIQIEFEYQILEHIQDARVGIRVADRRNIVIFSSLDADQNSGSGFARKPGRYSTRCIIPANILNAGRYYISVYGDIPFREWLIQSESLVSLDIEMTGAVGSRYAEDGRMGIFRPLLEWDIRFEGEIK